MNRGQSVGIAGSYWAWVMIGLRSTYLLTKIMSRVVMEEPPPNISFIAGEAVEEVVITRDEAANVAWIAPSDLGELYSGTWFPDGRRILFVSAGRDGQPRSDTQDIDGARRK